MSNCAWGDKTICDHILNTRFPHLNASDHFKSLNKCVESIEPEFNSVIDIGCCKAEFADAFPKLDYTGADLEHIIKGVSMKIRPLLSYVFFDANSHDYSILDDFDIVVMNSFLSEMMEPIKILHKILTFSKKYVIIHRQDISDKTFLEQYQTYGGLSATNSAIGRNDFINVIHNNGFEIVLEMNSFETIENNKKDVLIENMIELFNIPQYNIDTSKFSNLLHDKIVEDLEREFAEYVGAKYACSANSASSLLFLLLLRLPKTRINIPSTIPVVVPNVITNTNHEICFYDDINWVGHHYRLCDNIIDSAQEVSRDIYKSMNDDNACMVFSFYPTKPVGSCDGGMLVSNDEHLISFIKTMTMNGTEINKDSWSRKQEIAGYKMHMNSIQAYIAQQNLRKLDSKNLALSKLRLIYNSEFGLENTSAHLYRIRVQNNTKFIQQMRANNIQCGIHYQHCHGKRYFSSDVNQCLPLSEKESMQTVSIPFHENLTMSDIEKVVTHVKRFR